jgi:glycosyltransferase involved in cell wall biosynthesis
MLNTQPLVTFAVISYKHERFIAEAVESALAQTYAPLEVVICDDGSPDATFEIIEKVVATYTGPHKIITHRNARNLGLAGNVNKVWELSSGELVVFQGGDDISLPHRTARLVQAWQSTDPRPDLVYSGQVRMDEDGRVLAEETNVVRSTPNIADTITERKIFVAGGAMAAYTRQLHFFAGPLRADVIAEDFVYSFRAMLGNGVIGVPEALVHYRQHSSSIIGQLKSSQVLKTDLVEKYLLADVAKLSEYQKAFDAYGVSNPYLRWRLGRKLKTVQLQLQSVQSGWLGRLPIIFWSLCTLRLRAALAMIKHKP